MHSATSLEQDLGFLLAQAYRAMRRYLIPRLKPLGVTYHQFRVLAALYAGDDIPQTLLAERAGMDPTSLARVLARMRRDGLVVQVPDAADTRVKRVRLTAKARALEQQLKPIREQGLRKAVEGLDEKEVVLLRDLLCRVLDNMAS